VQRYAQWVFKCWKQALCVADLELCYKVTYMFMTCLHQIWDYVTKWQIRTYHVCTKLHAEIFFRLHVTCLDALGLLINLKWPCSHTSVCTEKKTPLEIHLMYLGKTEIYLFFMTWFIISLLFFTKCYLFYNFIFLWSSNMFSINHVPQFIHLPWLLQV